MKSFNQFLSKAYLCEAQVTQSGAPSTGQAPVTYGRTAPGGRFRSPAEQQAYERTSGQEAQQELARRKRQPTGAAARRDLQFQSSSSSAPEIAATNDIASRTNQPTVQPSTTTVSRQQMTASAPASTRPALPAAGQSGQGFQQRLQQIAQQRQQARAANVPGSLATRPTSTPSAPVGTPSNPERIRPTPVNRSTPSTSTGQRALPPAGQTSAATRTATNAVNQVSRSRRALDAMRTQWNTPGVKPGLGMRALGAAGAGVDAGFEYAGQRERGRSNPSAAAMGATKAAGGWAGAVGGAKAGAALGAGVGALFGGVGAAPGAAIGGLVGGLGGYVAGSELAGAASETVAGATGKEKAAMAQANRQRQAGGALTGIGGKTTFSQAKPGGPAFMSTGVGKQRRTVQLAKTSVVRGPGGKEELGHLAFKGGKAVYKRAADPSTLARTSSNPLERIGRSLFAGAYKKHDAAKAQQALQKARQSDVARDRKLGVKYKPGG